ncbi:MAG: single-stranded-DNA-specific exonuclease [Abditibacteriota bacterium]|nr:single-stranded-DNA-specific exonuclease [Abditibacteriota bacterium]
MAVATPLKSSLSRTTRGDYPQFGAPKQAAWKITTRIENCDHLISAECDISPVTAAILRARGYVTGSEVRAFLEPDSIGLQDPFELPDVKPAIVRLHRAIEDKEPFLVFGDYDVDGITSTAMLVRSLERLGAQVSARIPERRDGYDLSVQVVEDAHARGIGLILTADCGIRAFQAVERARELGIDVIITDHHEPDGHTLPKALAVINPKRDDSVYGFRELCGCGVAFKVMQALLEEFWPKYAAGFAAKYVEFVAMATIADCMPLEGENRILAREGLRRLAGTQKVGLQSLMQIARVQPSGDSLTGKHVSFGLAPRLNSAGRFDAAIKGLQLLMSSDESQCMRLAGELEEFNRERQNVTNKMLREAIELLHREVDLTNDCAIVLAGHNWSRGMVGLVASRLVERYARPAIVLGLSDGMARGSGRSISSFDMVSVVDATRHLLQSGGGHKGACGVHFDQMDFDEFRDTAVKCANEKLTIGDLVPTVQADCAVDGSDLSPMLVRDLEKLEPCGKGNAEPVLVLENAQIVDGKSMGEGGAHLKWKIKSGDRQFEAVWWRPGEKAMGFGIGKRIDLCFVPELNIWNGNTTLQLNIKEARLK